MAKQQDDAQGAADAALLAQKESHRNFQETIASLVVPQSKRTQTTVHLPEKDPKFTDWEGDGPICYSGSTRLTKSDKPKDIPHTVAVLFARHTMGVAGYWHFKEAPPIWAAFFKVLDDRFMHSDIKHRLTEEHVRLRMDGDDFNR